MHSRYELGVHRWETPGWKQNAGEREAEKGRGLEERKKIQ